SPNVALTAARDKAAVVESGRIEVIDIATNAFRYLQTFRRDEHFPIAFSPDGSSLEFCQGNLVVSQDLTTGDQALVVSVPNALSGDFHDQLFWNAAGKFIVDTRAASITRLGVENDFAVEVPIDPGENFVVATAVRDSGNRGPPSAPIEVI